MSKIIKVAITRHGEKDPGGADALTPHGAMQVFAAGRQLDSMGHKPDLVYFSGLSRALETARVMAAAMGIEREPWHNDGLDFRPTAEKVNQGNPKLVLHEKVLLDQQCGGVATLAHALQKSEYARTAKLRVEMTIKEMALAAFTRELGSVLGVSHSPWFDCAATHSNAIYGLPEAATIVWRVEVDEDGSAIILDSTYIEPPLPGKRN